MQKETLQLEGTAPNEFIVGMEQSGWRLDRFLADALQGQAVSREKVKKLIQQGDVTVNGVVETLAKKSLHYNVTVAVVLPSAVTALTAEAGELDVLYQDEFVAVVNKPAYITMHPCPSCQEGTFVNRLLHHFPVLAKQEGERPGIVHRLDKDTTGLLLVALTEQARLYFAQQFATRNVYKEYIAIVYGVPQDTSGFIDAPIGRHPHNKVMMAVSSTGKPAQSAWRVLYADPAGAFSVVAVQIFTGRTHQIRVHMTHIGHPLLGDEVYAYPDTEGKHAQNRMGLSASLVRRGVQSLEQQRKGGFAQAKSALAHIVMPRQMLHAWKLAFMHPLAVAGNVPSNMQQQSAIALLEAGQAVKNTETQGDWSAEDEWTDVPVDTKVPFGVTLPPPEDFRHTLEVLVSGMMPVVLTGNPGCGKSTILHALGAMGYPIWSADAVVKELGKEGNDGCTLLKARYGEQFILPNGGGIDKKALGKAMQQDDAIRKEVEQLLHPLVMHRLDLFWKECQATGCQFAFAEVPLYFEVLQTQKRMGQYGMDEDEQITPVTVGIYAGFAERQKRLQQTRGWTIETITAIDSWQIPEDKKMAACDVVVDNTAAHELAGVSTATQNATVTLLEQLFAMQKAKVQKVLDIFRE